MKAVRVLGLGMLAGLVLNVIAIPIAILLILVPEIQKLVQEN